MGTNGGGGGGDDGRNAHYYPEDFLRDWVRQMMEARIAAFLERERKRQEEFERLAREATEKQAMEAMKQQERQREQREQVAREEEREAKAAAKRAQKHDMETERKASLDQEALEQQARWRREGATTEKAKILACLHSSFCVKTQQRKSSNAVLVVSGGA